MSSRLPVPSKGALRTLRNLALGTSCTVAFTTGAITEDRRRRIHTAQKVHDNAKRIKSSRNYHGSGAAEAIEELTLRNGDEGFWPVGRPLPTGSVPEDRDKKQMRGHVDERPWQTNTQSMPMGPGTKTDSKYGDVHVGSPMSWVPMSPPEQTHSGYCATTKGVRSPPKPPKSTSTSPLNIARQSESRDTPVVTNRQHNLASDLSKLLEGEVTLTCINAAAARFFDAFEEGLPVDDSGISQELIDAAAQLSKACTVQKDFNAAEKIVQTVLRHGKLDLEAFLTFDPEAIMKGLIAEQPSQSCDSTTLYKANLRKACSLYLTNFKSKPEAIPRTMLSVGKTLCERACRYELFDLVEGLYWRVERYNHGTPLSLVKHLIIAAHGGGQHAKVLKYFRRFYIQTSPSQLEFYTVLGVVMKSIFDSDRHRVSEEILLSATDMAQRQGLLMSTTWFLKVIGHDWRNYRDIARTRALFDRIQPHLHLTAHPQAAYGAIIQFCIEADDEPAAASYFGLLRQFHNLSATDVRIHGHFTLAKAMRNDWGGVEENLHNIKQLDPNLKEFSTSFTPILRLFTQTHDVHETEEFLRVFIHQYGGLLTPHMSTIMISEYLKAGEFDSVSRWMDYMASVNCQVDPSFFNLVLKDCYYKFKLSYEEVCQLYQSVVRRDTLASRFVNSDTLSALRDIAMSSSGKNVAEGVKRLQYLKLHVPIKRINCGRAIREAMTVALAKGNPARALKMYRRALDDQVPLSEPTVAMAVMAALELDPDNLDVTASLLQDSQQNGQSVKHALSSMFVQLISRLDKDGNATTQSIKDLAFSSISTLDNHGISIPICVITHTMSILVVREQYHEAVDFWVSMSSREGHPSIPVDLYTLTALLRAYVGLRDPAGVEWVITTLNENKIAPDRRFQQTLVKACRIAEKLIAPYFTHSVVKALNTVNTMRADAIRDKEKAKMKILKIMESAIVTDEVEHPEMFDFFEVGFNKLDINLPKLSLPADSEDTRKYPAERSIILVSNSEPRASLIDVAAR